MNTYVVLSSSKKAYVYANNEAIAAKVGADILRSPLDDISVSYNVMLTIMLHTIFEESVEDVLKDKYDAWYVDARSFGFDNYNADDIKALPFVAYMSREEKIDSFFDE